MKNTTGILLIAHALAVLAVLALPLVVGAAPPQPVARDAVAEGVLGGAARDLRTGITAADTGTFTAIGPTLTAASQATQYAIVNFGVSGDPTFRLSGRCSSAGQTISVTVAFYDTDGTTLTLRQPSVQQVTLTSAASGTFTVEGSDLPGTFPREFLTGGADMVGVFVHAVGGGTWDLTGESF